MNFEKVILPLLLLIVPFLRYSHALGTMMSVAIKVSLPASEIIDFVQEFTKMTDHYSILEAIARENQNLIRIPSKETVAHMDVGKGDVMCRDNSDSEKNGQEMKKKVRSAIESALVFYSSHIDALNMTDDAAGLSILKVVDDKYGAHFQKRYPIADWVSQICDRTSHGKVYCQSFSRALLARAQHWEKWLNAGALEMEPTIHKIGSDKETVSPVVNNECMDALLSRCEIPHTCERMMFDPTPRSQYMLSHQLLHRMLAQIKMDSCGLSKRFVDEDVNQKLCSKMFHEANLISDYGIPFIFRDLFSEYAAFCGYVGYPNFFREDWLDTILSWQSKSGYGCFVQEKESNFVSSDIDIPRLATAEERKMDLSVSDEMCQTHFTAVSVSALAMALDYLEEMCPN